MHVILHGGAGSDPDAPTSRQATLDAAARAATSHDEPVGAVEAAVRRLESDPAFNAGIGGARQSDGAVRTDAGLMTDDRAVGAVAGLRGVEHPVTVARGVLRETPHVLLTGEPALAFAADCGVETERDLTTPETGERFEAADPPTGSPRDHLEWVRERFGDDATEGEGDATPGGDPGPRDHDTVGAVAREGDRFAAATSTGGRWFALAGRVGDVPQVGSGFYCSPAGGASATGAGEDIARVLVARRAVAHLESGVDPSAAADRAIDEFEELTGSSAGVVVLGADGAGSAFNSDAMQVATAGD